MMKKLLLSAAAGAAIMSALAVPAAAEGGPTFSGTFGVTSNYVFRGLTQSDNNAAVSLGLRLDYEGFYFGLWGSSIDFNDVQDSPLELDIYAGYAGSLGEATSYDIGLFYYSYPDSSPSDYNYFELVLGLKHDFGPAYVKGTFAVSPDNFNASGTGVYLGAGVGVPLTEWLEVNANVGHQWIDDFVAFGGDDYIHYDIGLTATLDILTLDLRWKDTDVEGSALADGRVYGGVTLNF